MLKLLVVDDEPDICSLISDALVDEGHEVTCAADGSLALELACATPFDVVVADMRLPGLDGLALFRRLREESPGTDMILITGNAAVADAVAVLKEGAFDYLTKPIRIDELAIQLNRIASFRALRRDVVEARAELKRAPVLDQLIGHSPEMLSVVKRIETVADCDAAVLILGESGTGKELVARALHAGSDRRDKAFVPVNCAAFPDTLIEAELFGHERGAFTGATHRREGRFKAAHGGTLFLDEVAELSTAAQAKLLRVLQEGTVEPLGSNTSIQVDVRIISATHQNLKTRVAQGQFREDLYYRINTIDSVDPAPARALGRSRRPGAPLHPALLGRATVRAGDDLAGLERGVVVRLPRQRPRAHACDGARGAALARRDHRARAPPRFHSRQPDAGGGHTWPADGAARRRAERIRTRLPPPGGVAVRRQEDSNRRVAGDLAEEPLGEAPDAWHRPDGRAYWVDGGMTSSP